MISASRLRNAPTLLFQEGEAGIFLDPAAMDQQYQDSYGTVPVTGFGQPVGQPRDLRVPLVEKADIFNDASVGFTGESSRVSTGVYRIYSSAGVSSGAVVTYAVNTDKYYVVQFTVDSITTLGAGIVVESRQNPVITTVGVQRVVVSAAFSNIYIKRASAACDIQISNVSIKELPGNHPYQNTSGSRPTFESRINLFDKTSELEHANWPFPGGTKVGGQIGAKGLPTATKFNGPSTGVAARFLTVNTVSITFSILVKWVSGATTRSFLVRNHTTATNFDSCYVSVATGTGGGTGWTVTPAGNGYFKLTYSRSTGITAGNVIAFYYGATGAVADSGEWLIDEPQVEMGSVATTYQAVNTATDYTDIGAPRYWQFDGSDDKFFIGTTPAAFYGANRAVMFGMAQERPGTGGTRVILGRSSADWYVGISASVGALMGSHSNAAGTQRTATHGPGIPVTAKHVHSLGWSTSGANVTMAGRRDGAAQTPQIAMPLTDGYTATAGGSLWALGDFTTANVTSIFPRHRLFAFVLRNAATTEAQYQQTERWITSRMQIAG